MKKAVYLFWTILKISLKKMQRKIKKKSASASVRNVDLPDDPEIKSAPKTAAQIAAEKRVRQIERWHKILAPQLPHIDPHDLDLIIDSLLKTPKERMQLMFLKRREDGSYVF